MVAGVGRATTLGFTSAGPREGIGWGGARKISLTWNISLNEVGGAGGNGGLAEPGWRGLSWGMNKMAAEADSLAQRVVEVIVGAMARMPTSALVPSGDPGEAGRVIAQRAALKAAAAAGVLGLPVGPLGWLTILPEMAKVWQIQAQMVSDLAAVYGQSAHGSREQMVYCLFRHGAAAAVRDLVVRVGERYAVKQGSRQAFQALAKRVGIAVSQRALGKGLARWVPVLGAVGVAGYAYFDTVQVARTAMELFARGVAEPLEGAEEGDGEGKAGAEGSVFGFESGGGGA